MHQRKVNPGFPEIQERQSSNTEVNRRESMQRYGRINWTKVCKWKLQHVLCNVQGSNVVRGVFRIFFSNFVSTYETKNKAHEWN